VGPAEQSEFKEAGVWSKLTTTLAPSSRSSRSSLDDVPESDSLAIDEEKSIGLDTIPAYPSSSKYEKEEKEEEAIDSSKIPRGRRRSQDTHSLKTVRSHHSRAGGDGYTCFDAEPGKPGKQTGAGTGTGTGVPEEGSPYLVSWDGDADPMNPRSMSMLRRWSIVLICAASSLCVYVFSSPVLSYPAEPCISTPPSFPLLYFVFRIGSYARVPKELRT
jgi:hypothetical protein